MRKQLIIFSSFFIAAGCGSDPSDTDKPASSTGGSASGGASSTASGGSSGGASASGGSGGAPSGGAGGSGGSQAGGAPGGGAGGMNGGSGGVNGGSGGVNGGSGGMNGGSGGRVATGGAPPMASEPVPSPGCSAGNPSAMIANSIIDVPDGYDGSTPLPLVVALHANGNENSQLRGYFGDEGKSRGYLLVYPKSAANDWSFPGDLGRIDAAYDGMLQNFCVDENRVFAIGHSGGAQTLTQMLCQGEGRFRAVAPVAASKYCDGWNARPAIVIHGICDQERGGAEQNPACTGNFPDRYRIMDVDGAVDFSVHKTSNMCSDEATPFTPESSCGPNINPGCVEYQGCSARTQFCNHDDPEYGNTNHGVPCFAAQVVFDFFDAEN